MQLPELLHALRHLGPGGTATSPEARLVQAQADHSAYADFLALLLQDELTRRADRLLTRRLKEARFRDPDKTLEGEAVEGLVGIAKPGLLEPAGEEAVGAAGEFVLEEEGEEVGVGAVIGLRLDEPRLEARGDAAETEVAERAEEFRELHRRRLLPAGRDPGGGRGRG